jgi:hypothetical protein
MNRLSTSCTSAPRASFGTGRRALRHLLPDSLEVRALDERASIRTALGAANGKCPRRRLVTPCLDRAGWRGLASAEFGSRYASRRSASWEQACEHFKGRALAAAQWGASAARALPQSFGLEAESIRPKAAVLRVNGRAEGSLGPSSEIGASGFLRVRARTSATICYRSNTHAPDHGLRQRPVARYLSQSP